MLVYQWWIQDSPSGRGGATATLGRIANLLFGTKTDGDLKSSCPSCLSPKVIGPCQNQTGSQKNSPVSHDTYFYMLKTCLKGHGYLKVKVKATEGQCHIKVKMKFLFALNVLNVICDILVNWLIDPSIQTFVYNFEP